MLDLDLGIGLDEFGIGMVVVTEIFLIFWCDFVYFPSKDPIFT
jgi:hypothetical protein